MLALRKAAPRSGLDLCDVAPPALQPGEVMIEVAAAGICGSDLHIADWESSYRFIEPAIPVTLGHEFSGRVVQQADDVQDQVGASVIVMPSVSCGRCADCRDLGLDHCSHRRGIGMARDGAFAPLVAVPAMNCVPMPAGLTFELAALAEPMTVSAQAVATGGVTLGSKVLVIGPGTIGQGIALLARKAGATTVVVTGKGDQERFNVLRSLGFDALVDMEDPDSARRLRSLAGAGFDVAFEAAGVPAAVQAALALLRPGGALVLTGIHGASAEFDATLVVRRSLQLRGSYRAPRALWPTVAALLAQCRREFEPLITHRVPLDAAHEGVSLARSRKASKVMILPRPAPGQS